MFVVRTRVSHTPRCHAHGGGSLCPIDVGENRTHHKHTRTCPTHPSMPLPRKNVASGVQRVPCPAPHPSTQQAHAESHATSGITRMMWALPPERPSTERLNVKDDELRIPSKSPMKNPQLYGSRVSRKETPNGIQTRRHSPRQEEKCRRYAPALPDQEPIGGMRTGELRVRALFAEKPPPQPGQLPRCPRLGIRGGTVRLRASLAVVGLRGDPRGSQQEQVSVRIRRFIPRLARYKMVLGTGPSSRR